MSVRFEKSGVHLYDRVSGLHVLLDEIPVDQNAVSVAPRNLSIAITDRCDFECAHCHVPRSPRWFPVDEILHICKEFEALGTLDVALGGGEPTLHPDFEQVCKRLWNETGLGVSFTTHGHHLSPRLIESIHKHVSCVRISLDGIEPAYSQIRKRPLKDLLARLDSLKGKVPFGFNVLITTATLDTLDGVLELADSYGACEILLLPIVTGGKPRLSDHEWKRLDQWICHNYEKIPLRVGSYARSYLTGPFLFDDAGWETEYAYLSTDRTLRMSSYVTDGINLSDFISVSDAVRAWRSNI